MGPVGSNPATKVSMPDALLDVNGLAAKLGVSVRFVRRLVEERCVPYLKIGRLVRFDPIEVEHWISASCVASHNGSESVSRRRSR